MTTWPSGMVLRPISAWPGEQTKRREHSRFRTSNARVLALLKTELRMIGARNVVLEVAMREQDFKINGEPRLNARPEHPGLILSFESSKGPLRYPADAFHDWWDNLYAIALTLEKLRAIDRYKVTRHAQQYAGWKQIEGTGSSAPAMTRDMAEKILRDLADNITRSDLTGAALLRLARAKAHPDKHNGDSRLWDNVEQAREVLGL